MPANFNDLRLNEDIRLEPHPVADADTFPISRWRTWWRRGAFTTPQDARAGHHRRVRHARRLSRTVSLVLNGRVIETKTVDSPGKRPRQRRSSFRWTCRTGTTRARCASIRADALPDDDHFYFAIERAEPRHALFVHEARQYARAAVLHDRRWRRRDSRLSSSIPRPRSRRPILARRSTPSWFFRTWARLPGEFENELRNYVRSGGSVLIALGHNAVAAHARAGLRRQASKRRATRGGKASVSRRPRGWIPRIPPSRTTTAGKT